MTEGFCDSYKRILYFLEKAQSAAAHRICQPKLVWVRFLTTHKFTLRRIIQPLSNELITLTVNDREECLPPRQYSHQYNIRFVVFLRHRDQANLGYFSFIRHNLFNLLGVFPDVAQCNMDWRSIVLPPRIVKILKINCRCFIWLPTTILQIQF